MADATVKIGWDNSQLQAGAKRAEKIVRDFASASKQAVDGLKASLIGIGTTVAAGALVGIKKGLDFNYELNNAEVGIANVLAKFMNLNREAAKNEAAKALELIKKLEPQTAGGLGDLVQGFLATAASAQSAGVTVEQNIELVAKFANALANCSIPAEQLSQEIRSIFSGNITADSAIARILQLTNAQVNAAKESGNLYEVLNKALGTLGEAGDSANVTVSSLSSQIDQLAGGLSKPIFDTLIKGAERSIPLLEELNRIISNFKSDDINPVQGLSKIDDLLAADKFKQAAVVIQIELKKIQEEYSKLNVFSAGMSWFTGDLDRLNAYQQKLTDIVSKFKEHAADVKSEKLDAETAKMAKEAGKLSAEWTKLVAKLNDVDIAKSAAKMADDIKKLQDSLKEEKNTTLEGQLSEAELLEKSKAELLAIDQKIAALRGSGKEAEALQAEIEREKIKQRILDLEKGIADETSREAEEAKKKSEDESRKKAEAAASLEEFQIQTQIADLQKKNSRSAQRKAEELERQLKVSQYQKQLMEQMNVDAETALKLAKERVDAESGGRGGSGSGRGRIKGYTNEMRQASKYSNPFRELDAYKQKNESLPPGERIPGIKPPSTDATKPLNAIAQRNAKEAKVAPPQTPMETTNALLTEMRDLFKLALN